MDSRDCQQNIGKGRSTDMAGPRRSAKSMVPKRGAVIANKEKTQPPKFLEGRGKSSHPFGVGGRRGKKVAEAVYRSESPAKSGLARPSGKGKAYSQTPKKKKPP